MKYAEVTCSNCGATGTHALSDAGEEPRLCPECGRAHAQEQLDRELYAPATNLEALCAQLREAPMDWQTRLVLADALADEGRAEEATLARDVAACVRAELVDTTKLSQRGWAWLVRGGDRAAGVLGMRTPIGAARSVVPAVSVRVPRTTDGSAFEYGYCYVDVGEDAVPLMGFNKPALLVQIVEAGKPLLKFVASAGAVEHLTCYVHPDDVPNFIR